MIQFLKKPAWKEPVMKTLVVFVLVLAVPVGLLTAGGETEKIVELEYLNRNRSEEWGREGYTTIKKWYEEQNPGIRIKYVDVPYDDQRNQMLLKAQAGTPPDLSEPVHGWMTQLVGAEILEPIKNYMSDDDLKYYVPAALEDTNIGGANYVVPY